MTQTASVVDFCCGHLQEAIKHPPHSFFHTENGVMYLSVGFARTLDGPAFYDQAILFCPFCGSQLQSAEEVAKRRKGA